MLGLRPGFGPLNLSITHFGAQPREILQQLGRAEPFRTSDGIAAADAVGF
jgi:hypothetical protein